jgi:hypothetical protein
MIWLDDEGHIVMRSNANYQCADTIVDYQKSLIYLIQCQTADTFNQDIHYSALDLLENILFEPQQITLNEPLQKMATEAVERIK